MDSDMAWRGEGGRDKEQQKYEGQRDGAALRGSIYRDGA
ncbi:hypothetical protein CAter282_4466 [Collimonas arenae]|uniref:Uncharacterized protein n=1 Tax=Collimonas arenae TaxID=279058 RepID=A0A127QQ98_9BURK|nr:hypothetical protein CAter10_4854 [Collimonas arenae]AMP12127.1 hypothetical protein CAter282_4466 [Collimonas arenae]